MQSRTVIGGGGTRLHVVDAGNPDGRPILFIHGFSQSWRTWRRQFESDLAGEFRLVGLDIRGHGQSEKPADSYGDSKTWADDIHAVIRELALERPVLCGWSYGGFIICDYVRHYGTRDISAVHFVGAATKINQEIAPEILGPEFLALLPAFFSSEVAESVEGLCTFIEICSATALPWPEFCEVLGYNTLVPPHIRQGLLSRGLDNDDILRDLRLPVLISQGDKDRILQPQVARDHAALIADSRLSVHPQAGHGVFIDEPERFNEELRELVESASLSSAPTG